MATLYKVRCTRCEMAGEVGWGGLMSDPERKSKVLGCTVCRRLVGLELNARRDCPGCKGRLTGVSPKAEDDLTDAICPCCAGGLALQVVAHLD